MKLNILAARIQQRRLAQAEGEVTQAQIETYYNQHRSQLLWPETRDIESIMTKREPGVHKAKREIESGERFMSVAQRVNVSPEGGLHIALAKGAGEPNFERVVFNARPHVLLGPVKQQLFYIFEVLRTTPPHEQTLAQAQSSIKHLLTTQVALPRLLQRIEAKWATKTTILNNVTPATPPA